MYSANICWAPSVCWAPVSAFKELTDKPCGLESWFAKSWLWEGPFQGLPDRGHIRWISIAASSPCMSPFPLVLAKGEAIHWFPASQHPCWSAAPDSCHLHGCVGAGSVKSMASERPLARPGEKHSLWVGHAWSQGALVSLGRIPTTAQWQVTHPWATVFLVHSE